MTTGTLDVEGGNWAEHSTQCYPERAKRPFAAPRHLPGQLTFCLCCRSGTYMKEGSLNTRGMSSSMP
eukprot:12906267-Prorocentrum_lima.AAC.1